MGQRTIISWTNRTWNPWRGCTRISPGCAHCYMFTAQARYGRDPAVVTRTQTWRHCGAGGMGRAGEYGS
jgi:protein gp37